MIPEAVLNEKIGALLLTLYSKRLSALDADLSDKIIAKVRELAPDVEFTFDTEPAPILGGCWVSSDDNRRQVNLDWQNLTQEMADTLAERLLPLL